MRGGYDPPLSSLFHIYDGNIHASGVLEQALRGQQLIAKPWPECVALQSRQSSDTLAVKLD